MIDNDEEFIFKITDRETQELTEKHTNPLNHIINECIAEHNPAKWDSLTKKYDKSHCRPIIVNELIEVIKYISVEDAIDVPTNKHGKISKKDLVQIIRDEFDLNDGENVSNTNEHSESYGEYDYNRDYIARPQKYYNKSVRVYPNLIGTVRYFKTLKKIEEEKTKEGEKDK